MGSSPNIARISTIVADNLIAVILAAILCVIIYLLFWQKKKMKRLGQEADLIREMVACFQPTSNLEKTGLDLIKLIAKILTADGYYLYIFDPKSGQYILKAARHLDESGEKIAPSYSGLLPYKKETYIPPHNLSGNAAPASVQICKEGHVHYLAIPVKGGQALFYLAPLKNVSNSNKVLLNKLSETLSPLMAGLMEREDLRSFMDRETSSQAATRNITSTAMDFGEMLRFIMEISLNLIGAAGGALLVSDKKGYQLPFLHNLDEEVKSRFIEDNSCHQFLDNLLKDESFYAISSQDKEFYDLPPYFAARGIKFLILGRITSNSWQGLAVYFYKEIPTDLEVHRFTGLQMINRRIAEIIDSQQKFNKMSSAYMDILKILVETIDNLQAHTVGYSDMMARYAEIIAKEMHLDNQTVQDVKEAAYLSNIGLVGFSQQLFTKAGKYNELEYETIKLHSQVGAQLVEVTTNNKKVASYILYHHERIDGNGYPAGLKGEEIPLGARIICVVQTFLAAINGRKYRDPKPFAEAIELLKAASGSQLDLQVVTFLINWFHKKQANPLRKGRSLGPCWEMKCLPEAICKNCPAYLRTDKNCWEIDGIISPHCDNCRNCFVYTEYAYRMAPKTEQGRFSE